MTRRAALRFLVMLRRSRLSPDRHTRASPELGANSPVIILNVDVFPAPLMPGCRARKLKTQVQIESNVYALRLKG